MPRRKDASEMTPVELELSEASPVDPPREERLDRVGRRQEFRGEEMGEPLNLWVSRLCVLVQEKVGELMRCIEARAIRRVLVRGQEDVGAARHPAREGVNLVRDGRQARDDHAAALEHADQVLDRPTPEIPLEAHSPCCILGGDVRRQDRQIDAGQAYATFERLYDLREDLDL
jgi:hypothetical protein